MIHTLDEKRPSYHTSVRCGSNLRFDASLFQPTIGRMFSLGISFLLPLHYCLLTAAPGADNIRTELKRTQTLAGTLEKEGLASVLAVAHSNGWSAPLIHSEYWVQRSAKRNPEGNKVERVKRDFG